MAFDQSTRGRLQKLVNSCRGLLSDEFSIQLQQTYGLDPKTGEVTPMARLIHLDDRQRHTAEVLRQTLAHYLGADADDTDHRIALLDRMVREQAFTVLNRLAALLMMEARGQLIESVSKGYQSRGYQLYSKIAGTALGETGQAYQVYLFSVFDELAQELPALFDRYAANGLLFPRETALRALLDELNHFDIEPLWAADETIGWIYQYFNSKEERKSMRDASQAPRNSRELAVRNQFFTPRYVVEFLVDNTLGRLWFNATGGQTDLRGRCHYLLVKPNEEARSAFKLRDPRTLKLLDPACGSMHFGLYAFDLFAEIYREAWAWEQQHGPGSLDVSTRPKAALKPLCQTYEDDAAFMRDVPRLIIENNIYGVDIDPRAAQIASLALWLRAQRAWHDASVKAKDRPLIRHGHVIAAIAPPEEREFRQQLVSNLDQRDAQLFDKTLQLLKGLPELGVLLQVEQEIPKLIRQVYVGKSNDLFAAQEQETWQQAEARLRKALIEFAQATKSTYQGRLFAQDALHGLRFIDLCSESFDVVLMNPPFGKTPSRAESYLKECYPEAWTDVYGSFIWRFIATDQQPAFMGCISSALFMYSKPMRGLRKRWVDFKSLSLLVELGSGVLDGATVDTALTISTRDQNEKTSFLDLTTSDRKEVDILGESYNEIDIGDFSHLYLNPFCYHLHPSKMKLWTGAETLDPSVGTVTKGNQTFDDFRFQRLRWEVRADHINNRWFSYEEGGEYQPFLSPTPVMYKWGDDGAEARSFQIGKYGTDAQVKQSIGSWFKRGITFPRVSSVGFGPRLMPVGNIFSGDSVSIFLNEDEDLLWVLGYLCSSWGEDLSNAFGRHRKIEVRAIANLPLPSFTEVDRAQLSDLTRHAIQEVIRIEEVNETSPIFFSPCKNDSGMPSLSEYTNSCLALEAISVEIDKVVSKALFGEALAPNLGVTERSKLVNRFARPKRELDMAGEWVSWLVGCAFGRWDVGCLKRSSVLDPDLLQTKGLPASPPGESATFRYASGQSVLLNDSTSDFDLLEASRRVIKDCFNDSDQMENWLANALLIDGLKYYFENPAGFFADHLKRYSRSSRRAPIYWPISTTSGSYTLWLNYLSLTSQTLYTAINDLIEPKLKQVGSEVKTLHNKGSIRTREDDKQFEELQAFELELIELRDTLLKLAPTYKPNHEDGVQITAAPLWPLFRHKPWQKILKDTWSGLEKGDYDWAHLAMAFWPERVREKCKADKSLAIAHGLEELYVEPDAVPKKARGKKKAGGEA